MTTYQDATCWACDQVEEKIVDGKMNFPECTFADALVEFAAGIELVQPENAKSYYVVTDELAAHLWLLAEEVPEFFDLCARICSTNLLADASLPKFLRIFASLVLDGEIKRPTSPNRPRGKTWLEEMFLWSTINEIERQFNLFPTRNDATDPKHSACDAMAEALAVCGCKTTYSKLKKLMKDERKQQLRDEFLACVRIGQRKQMRGLDPDATTAARARETVREIGLPPLTGSTYRVGLAEKEDPCRRRDTSPKRLSRSCARWTF